MCGIAGFIDHNVNYDILEVSAKMGKSILHRGPDAYGEWHDNELGLSLIYQRLAIIDLSKAGSQPMISHCNRYVMVFNGEIYNKANIKAKIEHDFGQINWRGHSDSEIILQAFAAYGLEKNVVAVRNCRNISKANMIHNDWLPQISVDPETYQVIADGELLTCEPAKVLPMAQRYFLF